MRRGEGQSEAPRFDMTDGAGIPFRSSKTWRRTSQKALILKRASWRVGRGSPEERAPPRPFFLRLARRLMKRQELERSVGNLAREFFRAKLGRIPESP